MSDPLSDRRSGDVADVLAQMRDDLPSLPLRLAEVERGVDVCRLGLRDLDVADRRHEVGTESRDLVLGLVRAVGEPELVNPLAGFSDGLGACRIGDGRHDAALGIGDEPAQLAPSDRLVLFSVSSANQRFSRTGLPST